jgi:hypothetical protein
MRMGAANSSEVGFESAPIRQQVGSPRRVKPFAARRLRRFLTEQGLTHLAALLLGARTRSRPKEQTMSPSSHLPTQRQLRYLRSLALASGTTFRQPATRREASREIDRLRLQAPSPEISDRAQDAAEGERLTYATAVHPDEVCGFGSSASWRAAGPPAPFPAEPPRDRPLSTELARYKLSTGGRVIRGERIHGRLKITDQPATASGRSYVVEHDLGHDGHPALVALLADYIQRARELDEVPMASASVRQLLGMTSRGA